MISASARLPLAVASLILSIGCSDVANSVTDDVTGGGGDDAFSRIYNSSEFQKCSGCHAPGAPGKTQGTEGTQDWSTRDKAYSTLRGNAAAMIGNFEGCNGVPFLAASAEKSLLVAAFDSGVRADFQSAGHADCNGDAISDQTLKIGGELPDSLLQELKDWVDSGAPDK